MMQLSFFGTKNTEWGFIISVSEGGGSMAISVLRAGNEYLCYSPICAHKGQAKSCEHVQFAREHYETVIAPTEEKKTERAREIAQFNLDRAREAVERLERQFPSEKPEPASPAVLDLGSKRKINVEK